MAEPRSDRSGGHGVSPTRGGPILVTGSHRGGTTWVGKTLALAPRLTYCHEPLNPNIDDGVRFHRIGVPYWFMHLDEANGAEWAARLDRVIHGRAARGSLLRSLRSFQGARSWTGDFRRSLISRVRGGRVVVKDPFSVFSAPWMASRYGMSVIVMIRHPAAFVASIVRKNWRFDFDNLLSQARLMERYLEPLRGEILQAKASSDPLLQASVLWKAIYLGVCDHQMRHPEWFFPRHEDFAMNAVSSFERLFGQLGLSMTDALRRRVERNCVESGEGGRPRTWWQRESVGTVDTWKTTLSRDQVNQIRSLVEPISGRWYDDASWA